MHLSIITPLFNRLDLTREFVAGLARSLPPGLEWECLLVDDASTDGTHVWLELPVGAVPGDLKRAESRLRRQLQQRRA